MKIIKRNGSESDFDLQNNIDAVIAIIRFIYDNIMYAELNTRSDYCQKCGFEGEIVTVNDNGKLVWECPCCGNRDQETMNVVRRTCGYLGSQYWNQGRTMEISERTLSLSIPLINLDGDQKDADQQSEATGCD